MASSEWWLAIDGRAGWYGFNVHDTLYLVMVFSEYLGTATERQRHSSSRASALAGVFGCLRGHG